MFSRNDTHVEHSWEDEDETRSSGGANDAKYVSDVGNKDDKQVDNEEETYSDGDVTDPVERFLWEKELKQGSTNWKEDNRYSESDRHQYGQTHTQNECVQGVHFTVSVQELSFCVHIESEVAKDGSEEVHNKHAKDGYVGNTLHTSLGWVA